MERQSFPRFGELPGKVQARIWELSCNVPRVVYVYETHHRGWVEVHGERNYHYNIHGVATPAAQLNITAMHSKTRPPAILGVCKVSRKMGLKIYKAINEATRTKTPHHYQYLDIPIYVNRHVDIIYRGKHSSDMEQGFVLSYHAHDEYGKKEQIHDLPIAFTRTLAVDLLALMPGRRTRAGASFGKVLGDLAPEEVVKITDQMEVAGEESLKRTYQDLYDTYRVKSIIRCFEKGVREFLVIVGNDDEIPEVEFVPLSLTAHSTPREKGALRDVERLKERLSGYWEKNHCRAWYWGLEKPIIKAMSIKRKPSLPFHPFRKLPTEIQDMIWKYIIAVPRVFPLTIRHNSFDTTRSTFRKTCTKYRSVPALLSISYNTRRIAQEETYKPLPFWLRTYTKTPYQHWNPRLDPILLEGGQSYLQIGPPYPDKYNLTNEAQSVALKWIVDRKLLVRLARCAKHTWKNLKEIIILLGDERENCLVVPEFIDIKPSRFRKNMELESVEDYVGCMNAMLKKKSNNWKCYQRRRLKRGLRSTGEWIPPVVRVAYMKTYCDAASPYSNTVEEQPLNLIEK